jgi:hypothetical protein
MEGEMSSSTIAWRTSKTTLESSKSILESSKKNREREILLDGCLEDEPDGTTPGRRRTKRDEGGRSRRTGTKQHAVVVAGSTSEGGRKFGLYLARSIPGVGQASLELWRGREEKEGMKISYGGGLLL